MTFVIDIFRPKPETMERNLNPWNAGTLEWTNDPSESWGMRSVPIITSRYPLWEQPNLQADIEADATISRTRSRASARRL